MRGKFWESLALGLVFFASFSSSPSYQLKSYSVGPGGTNSASSSTYKLQASVGEQTNSSTASANNTTNNGSVQTYQLNLPPAPTLGNGGGTYYNRLSFIINTGGNPSDTTYAVAVSTDSFATINYVQADDTLNTSPVFQTYTAWGGGSGSIMSPLLPSTTYQVKVTAMEGMFTNTDLSTAAAATIATVAPTITFSVSPNTISLGNLTAGSVTTSSNLSFTFATNADYGGAVYVYGQNTGLKSTTQSFTIPAFSGNLTGQSQGFGVQATNPSQSSGGPLVTVSPFNGTSNVVGAESTTPQQMLSTSNPIVGGTANANMQAKSSSITPASSDYQEILSYIASANF